MMPKFDTLKTRINADFEGIESYLQIEMSELFSIIDYKNEGSFILKNDKIAFKGENIVLLNEDKNMFFCIKNNKKIGFIPIDGKQGFLGFGDSHCDYILFDENDFCFVEMKLNANSEGERAIRKNRKKAAEQLSHTITFFDEKLSRNYEGLTQEAYISTPPFYPRRNASWEQMAVEFMEIYGIQLFESNEKICK